MIAKKVNLTIPSSLKDFECENDVSELRQKLSSVGWIQCDNPSCLKWRKVRLEVAQQVTEDTPWTCDMNEDQNYKSCRVPEEDTTLYDRLAKRVKLDIITSRLKPGALVWAKVHGYCRWPALITADPLNGNYIEEDEFEALQYHVEFLGEKRSHGWIRTNFIEVFGPGNIDLHTERKFESPCNKVQKGKTKKYKKLTSTSRIKHKDGSYKIHKAIHEALHLLPLHVEERLKTCHFVTAADVNQTIISGKRIKSGKIKAPEMNSLLVKNTCSGKELRTTSVTDSNHKNSQYAKMKYCYRNEIKAAQLSCCLDSESTKENTNGEDFKCIVQDQKCKQMSERNISESKINENLYKYINKPEFLLFESSLLSSSKEERFMKDIQMYQENKSAFDQEIATFMQACGLTLPEAPTWQHVQVSMYSMFLSVLERDGFLKVCEQHLWPSVYTELTHQHCRQGGGLVKRFYQRNLYPFELSIFGQDYTAVVKDLGHDNTSPKKMSVCETNDSGVDTDDIETSFDEEDGFDSPDVVKHLDELDQILKSLEPKQEKESADKDEKVHMLPLTGVHMSVENSICDDVPNSPCSDVQVLHEMQALQYDLDFLQDQIDLI